MSGLFCFWGIRMMVKCPGVLKCLSGIQFHAENVPGRSWCMRIGVVPLASVNPVNLTGKQSGMNGLVKTAGRP